MQLIISSYLWILRYIVTFDDNKKENKSGVYLN